MKIIVNAKAEMLAASCTIADFVAQKQIKPDALIVEHNERIIKQEDWAHHSIQDGDRLELLYFVGGG